MKFCHIKFAMPTVTFAKMPPMWTLVLPLLIAIGDESIGSTDANLAVIYDKGDVGIETIVAKALKHSKDIVANPTVHMKAIKNFQNIEDITDQLVEFLKEHPNLNFVLDFTLHYNSSHGIRNGLLQAHLPSISVASYTDLDDRCGPELVIVDTMERLFLSIVRLYKSVLGTLIQSSIGTFVIAPFNAKSTGDDNAHNMNVTYNLSPMRLSNTLKKYHIDRICLTGSHAQSMKMIQELVEFKADWIKPDIETNNSKDIPKLKSNQGTLFTSRFVWFSFSTQINDEFICPDFVEGVVIGNIRINSTSSSVSKNLKKYETKNFTDLFFADLIQISLKSFANLTNGTGNNTTKQSKEFKLKWAKNVESYLQSQENLLANYVSYSSAFVPDITVWIDYVTPAKIYRNVAVASIRNFETHNQAVITKIERIYVGAVLVVDPPFLFNKNMFNKDEVKDAGNWPNYFGYLRDLVIKIEQELPVLIYFESEAPYGKFDNVTKNWSGAIGKLQNGETDMILGALQVTKERLDVVKMTIPFFTDKLNNNATYAFAFRKDFNTVIFNRFNYMINKMAKQRHLDQLAQKWFHESPYNYTLSKHH